MNSITSSAIPHMLRHYRSETHWYIPHSAGQLSIELKKIKPLATRYIPGATYYTNATTTVSVTSEDEYNTRHKAANGKLYYDPGDIVVKWILPNGQVIEGLSIDVEVSAGETLCICNDFRPFCLIAKCNILQITYRDLPPFQGEVHIRSSQPRAIADIAPRGDVLGLSSSYYTGGFKVRGSATHPSSVYGTVKDINNLFGGSYKKAIRVNYAPNVTGDLADITHWDQKVRSDIWGTSTEPKFIKTNLNPYSNELVEFTRDEMTMSFHHCGVYGVPNIKDGNQVINWEYYACPNAKPEDFDELIDKLITTWFYGAFVGGVDGIGYVWDDGSNSTGWTPTLTCPGESALLLGYSPAPGARFIPPYGYLKISNRTADPVKRAEKLALLRTAGWTVEEIDDSQEEGIYATPV